MHIALVRRILTHFPVTRTTLFRANRFSGNSPAVPRQKKGRTQNSRHEYQSERPPVIMQNFLHFFRFSVPMANAADLLHNKEMLGFCAKFDMLNNPVCSLINNRKLSRRLFCDIHPFMSGRHRHFHGHFSHPDIFDHCLLP